MELRIKNNFLPKFILCLLICNYFYTSSVLGQKKVKKTKKIAKAVKSEPQQFYTCMINIGPKLKNDISKNNISNCDIFYSHDINAVDDGTIDTILFKERLQFKIPNKKAKGIAILDWEVKADSILRHGSVKAPAFKNVLQQYIYLIKLAKRERPLITWGIYNIPFTSIWWKTDSSFVERNKLLLPLTTLFEIWAPCFYDFYPDKTVTWAWDLEFYNHATTYLLKMAEPYNIKILPTIWHRYHDSEPVNGLKLIDTTEFSKSINAMLTATHNGKKAMGVMWWQEDLYLLRIKEKRVMPTMESFDENQYLDNILVPYFNTIMAVPALRKNK